MLTPPNNQTRGKALEEAFFYRMDRELIELLSNRLQRDEKIRLFANATGIRNRKRLESLVDSGFELSTLTAFIWVPLVFVAWADGNADEAEKKAIFDVLTTKGISQETASMMMAHEWFGQRPNEELWGTWEEFATATLASLTPAIRNELVDEIVGLCHVVAHASGGFLGVGTISETEAKVIDRVIRALQHNLTV
jgi:uncharacterized tellurite resistance protein B-like protein